MAKRHHRKKIIPVDSFIVNVESLSHDGRGIARVDGKTVFIDGALVGEEVLCQYTHVSKRYSDARAIEVLQTSSDRVQPSCSKAMVCGGCSLQHMSSAQQINHKQHTLCEQYAHFGGIDLPVLLPPMQAQIWGYRRKARLAVKYVAKKGGVLVGFREKRNTRVTEIDSCPVLDARVGEKIDAIRLLLDAMPAKASIPQIEVSMGDDQVALVFRHMELLGEEDHVLLKKFGEQHRCWIYLQPSGPGSVHRIYPDTNMAYLSYRLDEWSLEMLFQPLDFTQVNASINKQMVVRALALLELHPDDRVLDLFCGLGNFTLPIARHCKEVIGVEGSAAMVHRGELNAKHNQVDNAYFYAADLTQDFRQQTWAQGGFDKVLLDPPRSGALEVVQNISLLAPKRIVYVSCNPATLARDAGELKKMGYSLLNTGVMDMFPHTAHVESIAVFEK